MSIDLIQEWHARARPDPNDKAFNVQLGCHLEEVAEMLDTIWSDNDEDDHRLRVLWDALQDVSGRLKMGTMEVAVVPGNRTAFLDAAADQIVTAVGVAHCANMNIAEAVRRVNQSNWTKYIDGKPVFNQHGKIIKPEGYQPPDLSGLT